MLLTGRGVGYLLGRGSMVECGSGTVFIPHVIDEKAVCVPVTACVVARSNPAHSMMAGQAFVAIYSSVTPSERKRPYGK